MNQRGNALHSKLAAQFFFEIPLRVLESLPWVLFEVPVKRLLVFVTRKENHLPFLARGCDLLVSLRQPWREPSTWGAPVSGEIEGDHVRSGRYVLGRDRP